MAGTAISSRSGAFQFCFALGPSIEERRLVSAIQQTIASHAILRTRIVDHPKTGIVQVVLTERDAPRQPTNISVNEHLQGNEQEMMGMALALSSIAIVDHRLVLSMHHAVMDHSALTLLLTDIFRVYKGQELASRSPYKDFVAHCLSVDQSAAEDFWKQRFRGHPAVWPKVPAAYVAEATEISRQSVNFGSGVSEEAVIQISSFIGAAFGMSLAAYADSDSVAFGLILSGRNVSSSGHASIMGPTIAIVPIQVNVQGRSTVEAIIQERAASRRQLQTSPALHVGLPQIRTASEAASAASHFQAVLNTRPSFVDESASDTITYEQMREPPGPFALFLSCNLTSTCRGMEIETQFDANILEKRQMQSLINQFQHNLNTLMHADWKTPLKALPNLNEHDREQILQWNADITSSVERCLHSLFGDQAMQRPQAPAIEAADGHATYGQLDALATRIALELRRRGVVRGSHVPLIFENSLWATVAILAVMKAGAVYVPIGCSDPPGRKADLIRRVKAKMITTSRRQSQRCTALAEDVFVLDSTSMGSLPETESQTTPEVSPDDLAVILFISGSTGKPKGVLLDHRCLATSLTALAKTIGWHPGRRVLQFAAYVWNLSLGETFGALLFGGCLCVPSENDRVEALTRFLQTSYVDSAVFTPTVLRTLSRKEIPSLRTVVFAGEAISEDVIAEWGHGDIHLVNGWGPCETSIVSAVAKVRTGARYPESIGLAVGCALWLVSPDDSERLATIGSVGELCVEGPSVARGYLEDAHETSAAFIHPPSWALSRSGNPSRFFRTGDLARYNPDGSISFIGRQDHQVKIRGQRFELGEVEAAMHCCERVRNVVATTRISAGRTELVAVVALAVDRFSNAEPLELLTGEVGEHARVLIAETESDTKLKLPSYMVPTVWIAVKRMPRTASAKLDRVRVRDWVKEQDLSKVQIEPRTAEKILSAPMSDHELALQDIWATVLGTSRGNIGQECVFLQLGGDSIRAMQAAGLLRRRGYDVRTTSLLSNKTLAAIAGAVAEVSLSTPTKAQRAPMPKLSITLPPTHIRGLNVEHISKATDAQAGMLAAGQKRRNGYHVDFALDFAPGLAVERLKAACETVVDQHAILRTVFIQHGPQLYQVVLRNTHQPPPLVTVESSETFPAPPEFEDGFPMARFCISDKDNIAERLRVSIHHALYDAYSLSLILADLNAAYWGKSLSPGTPFHCWASQLDVQDKASSCEFWTEVLKGSSMSYLISSPNTPVCGLALDGRQCFDAPLRPPQDSAVGTAASILRAAWALLLSYALRKDDIVFGEVSAARLGRNEQAAGNVRGPSVNNVPVRAKVDLSWSLESLVSSMHSNFQQSMPHHQLGYLKVIRECTGWPNWTRFSSTVVYQAEGLLDLEVPVGDSRAQLSHDGKLGDTADVWVIASPKAPDTVNVELQFNSCTLADRHVHWTAQCLKFILEAAAENPAQSLQALRDAIQQKIGAYEPPTASPAASSHSSQEASASVEAKGIVDLAWDDTELFATEKDESGAKSASLSMADCGGDAVTAFLLSKYYMRQGYDVTAEDVTQRPTRALQAALLDERAAKSND